MQIVFSVRSSIIHYILPLDKNVIKLYSSIIMNTTTAYSTTELFGY